MQSVFVFLDIGKCTDFPWRNANVRKTQRVLQVIHICSGSSSYMFWIIFIISLIIIENASQMLRMGVSFLTQPPTPPICEQPLKGSSWIGLNKEWEKKRWLTRDNFNKICCKRQEAFLRGNSILLRAFEALS